MGNQSYDEFAIETALQHKEADGGTVTALTLGPADSDKVLKDAKAIGVDEIVRVWNESWNELDSNAIQSALAQAVTDLGADVVYCGKPQPTQAQDLPDLELQKG